MPAVAQVQVVLLLLAVLPVVQAGVTRVASKCAAGSFRRSRVSGIWHGCSCSCTLACFKAIKRRPQRRRLHCLLPLLLLLRLRAVGLQHVVLQLAIKQVLLWLFRLLVPCLLLLQCCRCICQLLLSPAQLRLQGRHLQHSNAHRPAQHVSKALGQHNSNLAQPPHYALLSLA
jgi:hypothetical protein